MRNQNTFNLTLIAIFTAIIFLQAFVPNLGYIVIVPTLPAITTIVLTVSIGGSLLGPCQGAILGLIWGMISLYMAYTRATDPITLLLFQNPVIAVVPRVLVGVLSGLVAQALKKGKYQKLGLSLSGVVGALTNTLFVILLSSLFYLGNPDKLTTQLGNINQGNPLIVILLIALGLNGVLEALAGAVVTPIIVAPLRRVLGHFRNR